METLGDRFKRHRKALRMSRDAAAAACGVSRSTIQLWEADSVEPQPDNMKVIDAFLARPIPATGRARPVAWLPTPAQRKALLHELEEDYPRNIGITYGHAPDGRFTATLDLVGQPSVRLTYGSDGGIEARETLGAPPSAAPAGKAPPSTESRKDRPGDLTDSASPETVAPMSYEQLASMAQAANSPPKILVGHRITKLLKLRLEAAAKATDLDEATIMRAALLLSLPPTDEEERELTDSAKGST